MTLNRREFLKFSGLAALTASGAGAISWTGTRIAHAAPAASEGDQMLHVLKRLTWGVRPQDIEQIKSRGIEGYIDWQLNPEAIDDPAEPALIADYPELAMASNDLVTSTAADYEHAFRAAIWGRLYRAAYSERQLNERMVEFWNDHFNIPIPDLLVEKIIDDREVIRRHALGKFRDLLLASAQSRAMLIYLDNAYSEKEHPNENYAREVMELHTLGVDGGYTEQDVREVARTLTGWSVRDNWMGFYFNPEAHDTGEKTILGQTFTAGRGIEDGLQLIDLLATHPSTASFISRKLVRRFVSDTPPASLVESAAAVFMQTDGDIRQVMRHILLSAEFMQSGGQKFRRPLDFVVGMLRAFHPAMTVYKPDWVAWSLEPMGQLPYHWFPPNGYPDAAPAWMSTSGLLARWNAAMWLSLASMGWYEGVSLNYAALFPQVDTAGALVDLVTTRFVGGTIEPADREMLSSFLTDGGSSDTPLEAWMRDDRLPTLAGLVLCSPYFQWV